MIVAKRIGFDAAHYLPRYSGKCGQVHGHHWVVEIGIQGKADYWTGMVVDFGELKAFLMQIKEKLDHKLVNDILENPTAENICLYIRDKFWEQSWGLEELKLEWVKVWETEDSYVEWR